MLDKIPLDIQIEIFKRLPIKFLIRFTSVSKQCKSLIHSSKFVNDYSVRSHHHHLFLTYQDTQEHYLSFVDDDTFPQEKFPLFVPEFVNLLEYSKVDGSSHGLFCLVGHYENAAYSYPKSRTDMAVIWNPSIRKSVAIVVPNVVSDLFGSSFSNSIFGFGVCPNTCDPKIVKINQKKTSKPEKLEDISCTNWQVEVFTLSSGAWIRSPSSNLPSKWLRILAYNEPVVIDGFIYWVAYEGISLNDKIYTLISFDLTSEEFKQVYLPDNYYSYIEIFKLRESLAIYEKKSELVYTVWIMENGASKSFTQLYTVDGKNLCIRKPLGFRKNGQLIAIRNALVVYDPVSKKINNILGDYWYPETLYVSSYTESLLLLDQPDTLFTSGGD